MAVSQDEVRRLACAGLRAEIERLNEKLSELEGPQRGRKPGRPSGSSPQVKQGRRKGMSAKARKAASVRMKRYWAERRAKKS